MPHVRSSALYIAIAAAALIAGGCASANAAPTWTLLPVTASSAAPQAAAPASTSAAPANAAMAGMAGTARTVGSATTGAAGPSVTAHLDPTIVTGDMIGHTEFPAFIPSDFTLPAKSIVVVTITNFDDATALPNGSERYAKVTGTVGQSIDRLIDSMGRRNRYAKPEDRQRVEALFRRAQTLFREIATAGR